ncbi:mitochondrial ABC transporter A family member 7-like [Andalucia godoyi]|uniref:Mitochondrial ABC transporter A family member 7-like n=1 Tax=Andalucia godoyi TaxID=505711 RepID=A0A8K0AI69_ANDGO|nr:mitochondrial ABC transporter A family member 7-like [Andalucia godoyi]|eukprot:ANDGO_02085.mRNA.1 mitochondrial ABC transporter A family member 7-like
MNKVSPQTMQQEQTRLKGARTSTASQFNALFRKQGILQRRQKKTNCCQVCFPMFLLLILALVSLLSKSLSQTSTADRPSPSPLPGVINMQPRKGGSGQTFPYTFVSGSNATSLSSFLDLYTSNNVFLGFGGQQAPNYPPFQQFADKTAIDQFLYSQYGEGTNVPSAFILEGLNASSSLRMTIYYNASLQEDDREDGSEFQDLPGPLFSAMRSFVQVSAARLSRTAQYVVQYQRLPSKSFETYFDFAVFMQTIYITWILHLLMPVFVDAVVFEKQYKLKNMMRMMGLRESVYWWVQYAFDWALYLCSMIVLVVFGNVFQLRFFTMNEIGLYIILFIIWGFTVIAMSLLATTMFKTTQSSTITLYFYIIIAGIAAEVTNSQLMDEPGTSTASLTLPSIIPTFAVNRGLLYLSLASSNPLPGLTFSNANSDGNLLYDVYGMLIGEAVVMYVLFFLIEFWPSIAIRLNIGSRARALKLEKESAAAVTKGEKEAASADVLQERRRVDRIISQMKAAGVVGTSAAADSNRTAAGGAGEVEMQSPRKSVSSTGSGGTRSSTSNVNEEFRGIVVHNIVKRFVTDVRDITAVDNVSLAIPENSLLGMLGHNGAGKTTLISMLCGLHTITSGEAYLGGYDVATEMETIYSFMGVCPQFDILWPNQTGREHLIFYGRLKGLKGKKLFEGVDDLLKKVNLSDFANVHTSGYSGGMRRRLSVAMSLIGDPKIVFLDEPTTGLDPHSRRELWDVIQAAKPGRALVLTTHSMEEADALSDRIAIMNHGKLVAIGHAEHLKTTYGEGYRLATTVSNASVNEPRLRQFVLSSFAGARLVDSLNGTSHFSIPYGAIRLADVFRKFDAVTSSLGISDWGISKTSLEEVFENLTHSNAAHPPPPKPNPSSTSV